MIRAPEARSRSAPTVPTLAERLHVGERHLRRLLTDSLGTSPQQLQATRRLLFAKQLLSETTLPITQVADAAGFQSLRRFNDAFAKAYGMSPSRLRKTRDEDVAAGPLVLRLAYRRALARGDLLAARRLAGRIGLPAHRLAAVERAIYDPRAARPSR